VKVIGLLLFMLGATETAKGPEVAPDGIVMVIDVSLQELIVTNTPFSSTALLPCDAPNPLPVITTGLPIDPVVLETLLMVGAGAPLVLRETLSRVAVSSAVLLASALVAKAT